MSLGLVDETKASLDAERRETNKYMKYAARRDRVLATIVLAVDLPTLYHWRQCFLSVPEKDMGEQTELSC